MQDPKKERRSTGKGFSWVSSLFKRRRYLRTRRQGFG
jgi:hypothetical protein